MKAKLGGITIITILIVSLIFFQLGSDLFEPDSSVRPRIGVVDSGCSQNQKSFVQEYKSFTTTQYGFFIDDDNLYDDLNHGTLVCEIINDESPDSIIFSARIANSFGSLTYQSIAAAVDWLVSEKNVDIINLSLGSIPYISDELDEMFIKYQNDTTFVAASGNSGTNGFDDSGLIDWPAVYPWVIGVNSYNPANGSQPAIYAVGGLGYFGQYVTEYSASGQKDGKSGSSFSSPRVAGKLGQLLSIMRNQGLDPTTNQLQAYFSTLTFGWANNQFTSLLGWGSIRVNLLDKDILKEINLNEKLIVLHGVNELDIHKRFQGENWSRIWKLNNLGDLDIDQIQVSGNGTSMIQKISIDSYSWGSLLQIDFQGIDVVGQYSLLIGSTYGNNFTYSVNIDPNPKGITLLDHRASINGFGHPYAEFINFEGYLRSNGYIVEHALLDDEIVELERYDSIVVPKFLESLTEQNFTISRTVTTTRIDQYISYVSNGGLLVILGNLKEFTDLDQALVHFPRFQANYTGIDVGTYQNLPSVCCPKKVSNFTSNDISEGVDEFFYYGGEITSTNNTVTELGWVLQTNNDPLINSNFYLSIGVLGSIGLGRYMILGGSNFITNPYFRNVPQQGFNILYENFIGS